MALKRYFGAVLVVLAAGFTTAPAVHAVIDDEADVVYDAADYDEADAYADEAALEAAESLLDEYVPTSETVAACPEGTAHLLYDGDPVTDAAGNPVCVNPQMGGTPGETIPGENGEAGGTANSEGVPEPGEPGEVVNPAAL